MEAELSLEPKSWADVVHAVGSLSTQTQVMIFAAFVLWLVCWRGFAWFDHRARRRQEAVIEAAKERRNEMFCDNMSRLNVLLEQHTSDEEANATNTNRAVGRLAEEVGGLSRRLKDLRDRMSQVMSRHDSLTAIQDKLQDGVRAEVAEVFEQSLRKNDFVRRAEFIQKRVKTALGDILERAHRKLKTEYALGVDPDPFFPTRDTADGGTRHTLCDVLWERVQPLYLLSEAEADKKVEEMRIIVENTISDLVARVTDSVSDLYRDDAGAESR